MLKAQCASCNYAFDGESANACPRCSGSELRRRTQCPCCGFFSVIDEFDICPVCFWQHDSEGLDKPDGSIGGANGVSLDEARKNYKKFGTSEPRLKELVRPPLSEEYPENNMA